MFYLLSNQNVVFVLSSFGVLFISLIMIGLIWFLTSDIGTDFMEFMFPSKPYNPYNKVSNPYQVYVPPIKTEPYGETNEPIALGPIEYPTYKKWTPPTYEKRINLESFNVSTGKKTEVFVAEKAIKLPFVDGYSSYSENQTTTEPVKLVRSGSGYRVYGHPSVENGKWLSCRT